MTVRIWNSERTLAWGNVQWGLGRRKGKEEWTRRVQKLTTLKLSVPWVLARVTCQEDGHSWPEKASGLTVKANVDGKDQNKIL